MTAVARRIDVLEAQLRVLQMLESLATPGPWDSSSGWVVAPGVGLDESRYPNDADSFHYYGGNLVCESIGTADALLVATARNVIPGLALAHLDLLRENAELRQRNRLLESLASAGDRLRAQLVPAGVVTLRRMPNNLFDATRTYVRRFGSFPSVESAQRAAGEL